jgi:hypothetical protein
MPKTCLIIDDNPQDDVIERIESRLKGKYFPTECLQFNVGSQERTDLLTDGRIDVGKVVDRYKTDFTNTKLDLICIDYNLEDDNINGLDILKEIHPVRPKCSYMIYSANLNQVVSGILDGYDEGQRNNKLLNKIKFLTRYKIVDFVARTNYEDAVIAQISEEKQSLESMVEEKLLEYRELVFENTYPSFAGKTLFEIAREIRIGSDQGNNFMKEIIEVAISNMILINH